MTVGLTGGTGSGKSTVGGMFADWGAFLIDADAAARDAVSEPGALDELVAGFGRAILTPDGRLDRRALGQRAFADEASRTRLTDVVWPRVGRRLTSQVSAAIEASPGRIVVLDAPVLLEWGDPDGLCDRIVVVTAPESLRVARTVARLGISEDEVRARMAHQMPEEEKVGHADLVIVNDADLAALEHRARSAWDALVAWSDTDR